MVDSPRIIPNYIYFYHLDKFCVLPLYPESISDRMATSFQDTNALSRSAPVFTFSHSGPREVSINLKLHRDMMNDLNRNVSNLKENVEDFTNRSGDDYVDLLVKYLQAAALPKYQIYESGSKSVIPPMVAIRFGDDIFIKGVVTSGVTVTFEKPIMTVTTSDGKSVNKYSQITVDFSVSETDPYDANSVVSQGSFRGASSTFKDGIYKSSYGNANAQTYDSGSPESSRSAMNNTIDDKILTTKGEADTRRDDRLTSQRKNPYVDFIIKGGIRKS